ncbi:alpha/beta-hydrolase [Acaromyces ingoldii]|uniref:Alpha/beta-hydrolase n=1 Tax=Acaromyces ingoldii TaxID=215250 RepID=A0A316YQW1_9BASI|nr:alpha/beta-hydrolase [Acaromyces ingoldii]PWN91058.1 alpha/beta-hydrolase [Acaromyces ingoldii]
MTLPFTYATAPDQHTAVLGVKLAYRSLGVTQGVPLLLNTHFRGTMDHWDPVFLDSIAAKRHVILFDNAGVGRSEGEVPLTYAGWAKYGSGLMAALGIEQYDVFGFSMGGFVAQLIALEDPLHVRRLILAGTGPSAGDGVMGSAPGPFEELLSASDEQSNHAAFVKHFFSHSAAKQQKGEQWWERMTHARSNRSDYVGAEGTRCQVSALQRFFSPEHAAEGTYDRLDQIKIPVLIANGSNDVLIATDNSIVLWRRLINAPTHLHLYPDSGHGFLDEFSEHFSQLINDFLE